MQLFLIPVLPAIFECAIVIARDLVPMNIMLPFVTLHSKYQQLGIKTKRREFIVGKLFSRSLGNLLGHTKKLAEFVTYLSEMTYL